MSLFIFFILSVGSCFFPGCFAGESCQYFSICMDTFGQLAHVAKKPKPEVFLIVLKTDEIMSFMSCLRFGLHFICNKGLYAKV